MGVIKEAVRELFDRLNDLRRDAARRENRMYEISSKMDEIIQTQAQIITDVSSIESFVSEVKTAIENEERHIVRALDGLNDKAFEMLQITKEVSKPRNVITGKSYLENHEEE